MDIFNHFRGLSNQFDMITTYEKMVMLGIPVWEIDPPPPGTFNKNFRR